MTKKLVTMFFDSQVNGIRLKVPFVVDCAENITNPELADFFEARYDNHRALVSELGDINPLVDVSVGKNAEGNLQVVADDDQQG